MHMDISKVYETHRGKMCVVIDSFKYSEFRDAKTSVKYFVVQIINVMLQKKYQKI